MSPERGKLCTTGWERFSLRLHFTPNPKLKTNIRSSSSSPIWWDYLVIRSSRLILQKGCAANMTIISRHWESKVKRKIPYWHVRLKIWFTSLHSPFGPDLIISHNHIHSFEFFAEKNSVFTQMYRLPNQRVSCPYVTIKSSGSIRREAEQLTPNSPWQACCPWLSTTIVQLSLFLLDSWASPSASLKGLIDWFTLLL